MEPLLTTVITDDDPELAYFVNLARSQGALPENVLWMAKETLAKTRAWKQRAATQSGTGPPKTIIPDVVQTSGINRAGENRNKSIRTTTLEAPASQELTATKLPSKRVRRKVLRWGKKLTDHCPYYMINEKLANCRTLTHTERACIGLLNALLKAPRKEGRAVFAFLSDEQLAHWLDLTPNTLRNLLTKLRNAEFIQEFPWDGDLRKLTVRAKWLDPLKAQKTVTKSAFP
jgi:hypothetical protein